MRDLTRVSSSRTLVNKEPRELNKKNPGKTYLPRFLDESDLNSLKSSVDRELADISMYMEKERQITSKIIPGSSFKGNWDACSDKYPDHGGENSTWDVIVTCGNSHVFDNKTWEQGHQLIYLSASDIFVQRTNPGLDGMKHEVETLKVEVDNAKTLIEENKIAIADTNFAMGELKTELTAKVNENTAKISKTNQVVADLTQTVATNQTTLRSEFQAADRDLDGKLTGNINKVAADLVITNQTVANNQQAAASATTALKSEMDGKFSTVNQTLSTTVDKLGKVEAKWGIEMNVNGYVSGVSMNNDGSRSNFKVLASRFEVTDGASTTVPFTIEGGKTTMNNAIVRGHIEAGSGSFKGNIQADSGYFKGTLQVSDQAGNVGMKITNSQILIYDEQGRLRVKIGRL